MNVARWVLGAVAAGLAFGAVEAKAAPMLSRAAVEAPSPVQSVQFYYDYDEPPPVYDDPPPPRYYYPPPRRFEGPPPPRYYGPPRGYRPPPPPQASGPRRGYRGQTDEWANRAPRREPGEDAPRERRRPWSQVNGY